VKRLGQIVATLAVSAAFLYLALRRVPPSELWAHMQRAHLALLALAGALHALKFYLVGVRWGVLLDHVKRISRPRLYPVVAITYMANNVLPLRAGEIIRVFVLGRREGVSKSAALGSVVVERTLDGVALLTMFLLACALTPVPAPLRSGAVLVGAALGVVVVLLFALVFARERALAFLHALLRLAPARLRQPAGLALERFVQGLNSLRSGGQVACALGLTFAHWLSEAFVYYLVACAVGAPLGYFGALFVTVVVNVGILIPASPGYVGTFEYFATRAAMLMGAVEPLAAAYALLSHVVIYFPITAVGLACFAAEGVSLKQAAKGQAQDSS